MVFLKKEWRALLIGLWLIIISYLLIALNGQLSDLKRQNLQVLSTLDSVESVVISTDASIADMGKKIDGINSNVEFVVSKVRRR